MTFLFQDVRHMFPITPSAVKRMEQELAEALEKQLEADIELIFMKMLLWGAVGALGAIFLAGASLWVWSKMAHNEKMAELLEQLSKNQGRVEMSRSACLQWQLASIKDRERAELVNEQMRYKRKHAAMTQSQLEVERSERLRLELACAKERVQKAEVASKVHTLQQEIDDLKLANLKLLRTIHEIGELHGKLPRQ